MDGEELRVARATAFSGDGREAWPGCRVGTGSGRIRAEEGLEVRARGGRNGCRDTESGEIPGRNADAANGGQG